MPHFMEDPAFWVSLSFIILVLAAIKPVYGKVPSANFRADSYSDVVTATVTW